MHPRNRYNKKLDFAELADFHPPLKPHLIKIAKTTPAHAISFPDPTLQLDPPRSSEGRNVSEDSSELVSVNVSQSTEASLSNRQQKFPYTLDFSRPEVLKELTYAVLKRDFDLDVCLPLSKLIPAVPQRLNYIHWVEDLVKLCEECSCADSEGCGCADSEGCGPRPPKRIDSDIIGIDIGTGASCIYCLLGARLNGWQFLATDIDAESVEIARENVLRNKLENKIKVIQVSPQAILEGVLDATVHQYVFCMCNPPFFKHCEERLGGVASGSRSGRRPHAGTFSSANVGESVTEGGEVEFVSRIIRDSSSLGMKVRWYTSMLGKKASLKALLAELEKYQVPVVTTTEFVQGKTWRWGIGWSFDTTLKTKVTALSQRNKKRKEKPISCLRVPLTDVSLKLDEGVALEECFCEAKDLLIGLFQELKIEFVQTDSCSTSDEHQYITFQCSTCTNTWSHQRKRKRIVEQLKFQIEKLKTKQYSRSKERVTEVDAEGGKEIVAEKDCTDEKINVIETDPKSASSHDDKSCMQATDPKWSVPLSEVLSADIKCLEQNMKTELDNLSPPCFLKFKCRLLRDSDEESSKKRKLASGRRSKKNKLSSTKELTSVLSQDSGNRIFNVEFEWLGGEERDSLHQIVQFFVNKLQQKSTI